MNVSDYLIDQEGLDWTDLVSAWSWILPEDFTIWLVNRFGDLFIVPEDGTIQRLDVGTGALELVAKSREEFISLIDQGDNAKEWLLIPQVDQCVSGGLVLNTGQCYGYLIPPIFEGGEYSLANFEVTDISVHLHTLGQIHQQLHSLPDGTRINQVSITEA